MEHVDSFHLLARTNELDGFGHHRTDTQGSTTTGISIELREYHTVEIQTVVELLRRIHSILTGHGVHHKQGLVRLDGLFQVRDLLHHLLIDSQSTGSIDDDDGIALLLRLADGVLGDLYHVLIAFLRIDIHTDGLAHHLQLLDGSRTVHVAGHQQRFLVLTCLQHIGQLTREGSLTGTLQARHQNDGRTALEFQLDGLTAHELRQLVVNNLHQQLTRLDGSEHVHTHRLLLHRVCKLLGNLIVHVGIQQSTTNILQRLGNINLRDFALTFQYLERPFKSVT